MSAQILAELIALRKEMSDELGGLRGQVRDLRTVLLGDGEGETKHGRIPMLEARVDDHEARISDLEKTKIKWTAYGFAAGAVVAFGKWALDFLFGRR